MKIKRIEISGFKSFADRVVLDFQQGVTGVVGPNGCGKSNIVDAIRWCMGEQSAKNLRGKAMEDVIFVGSETRKPQGLAEVSLVFSTEDGRVPAKYLDYTEIQLTRRLYRDGESDYLINNTPCRLLDITELFMDTGVGTRAYSIIEQGKIGMILHSRPEERRFLIEEAAGVTKYKSRKQSALRKIDATRQNLARLSDVIGEIRRQLSSLQRQAKKAEKFRELREELRGIDLAFAAGEYRSLQKHKQDTEKELVTLNDSLRAIFGTVSLSEMRVEACRVSLLEAEKSLTSAQEGIYSVKSEQSATESALEFQKKELAALAGRLERLAAETGGLARRRTECDNEREHLEQRPGLSATDAGEVDDALQAAEKELAGAQQHEVELVQLLETKRRELFSLLAESAQHKNRIETASKRLTALTERQERHERESSQLEERRIEVIRRHGSLEEELVTTGAARDLAQRELDLLKEREAELRERLPQAEQSWQTARDNLSRTSSRLYSLRELEAQFTGYGQGVRTLMKAPAFAPRFAGLLADAVVAAPEYERALEAALAERLQYVLCENDDDALQALAFLKNGNGGRAGIATPAEHMSETHPPVSDTAPLSSVVRASGRFALLIGNLLASVMLVDDARTALALARRYPLLTFVTREGDVAGMGGVLTGGSPDQSSGIIHKKREIRELADSVTRLEEETAALGGVLESLRVESRQVTEGLKEGSGRLHQIELKLAGARKDHQQSGDELIRIDERRTIQALENTTLLDEYEALEEEIARSKGHSCAAETAARDLESENGILAARLDTVRMELALQRERVTAIRIRAATLKEQQESRQRALAALVGQLEDIGRRMAAARQEQEQGVGEQAQLEQAVADGKGRLDALALRQVEADRLLKSARDAWEQAGQELSVAETAARDSRMAGDAARQSQADLNLRFSTVSMQLEHLEQSVRDKCRIEMSEALERFPDISDVETSRMRQIELKLLLDEIGEVNLMAIDEYAGMEERHTFLTSQKDDLEESLNALQQAIQRINRTTRKRFLETYNLVNAKFQEVFPRLFCGGHAELRLTNEEDLLETGIDIIVQPPGKKLQNVTLLSGGEKALTAVALIFSIFLIKPTPFCLLDEVDAPLDDANIGRFNEMVREMSAISQFIIITHNKATMQVADMLYGVTMEEPGASRIVSVRLH